MAECDLTAQRARELFDYDPETGILTRKPCAGTGWKPSPMTRVSDPRGYMKATIGRKNYFVHRLIWLVVHGQWPVYEIDHINRNAGDNRIENLRDVPRKENLANRRSWAKPPRPKKPKRFGWVERDAHSQIKPYRARYMVGGVKFSLGYFATPEDAKAALVAHKQNMESEL